MLLKYASIIDGTWMIDFDHGFNGHVKCGKYKLDFSLNIQILRENFTVLQNW